MQSPSKELLSEVLGVNICYFVIRQNEVIYTYDDCDDTIDIYELAHKCKEWALSKGYIVDERGVNIFLLTSDGIDVVWQSYGKPFCPYRVFEPCEWILNRGE